MCPCRGGAEFKKPTNASLVCNIESDYPVLAATTTSHVLKKSILNILVDGESANGLVDTGSSHGYMAESYQRRRGLQTYPTSSEVSMASASHSTTIKSFVSVDVTIKDQIYKDVKLMILPGCVSDVILGLDFQEQHAKVTFLHKGHLPPLEVCGSTEAGFSALKTEPPELFANLTSDCHPVREKSRRYSKDDRNFIANEVRRLEAQGIIERSNSPWRAQVVVVKKNDKNRLVIDYSTTINQFTLLDAYPLPSMMELINEIALYKVFSTIDLRAAYHQIIIRDADKPYTAFEANNRLFQFKRLPFGVMNGFAVF